MKKSIKIQFLKGNKARFLFSNSFTIMVFLFSFLSSAYSQNIGINTTGATPNSKVLLDINSDNSSGEKKGLLIPRMNTTERNAISASGATTESLLIYNTTTQCFEAWNEITPGWVAFGCLNCQMPGAFNASAAIDADCSSFTANWSASAGATGYYLDVSTSSTFSSFVAGFENLPITNVITYSVTGLVGSTTYYYRVRAINTCGTSINSNTTTVVTSLCLASCDPTQNEAGYDIVVTSLSGSSKTWITRNLGATTQATSPTDDSNTAAGCYFQFNRSQAYTCDNGGTVNPAWTSTSISENSQWLAVNDPCTIQLGGSWRLPTYTECLNTDANGAAGGWDNYTETFADVLKIHAAGMLEGGSGFLWYRGIEGNYWSSTQYGSYPNFGWDLTIDIGNSDMQAHGKYNGFPVRCLK